MRLLAVLLALGAFEAPLSAQEPQDSTQFSQVMGAERVYRVYLPGAYADAKKRFPVIYWFHGYESSDIRAGQSKTFAEYVAAHEVIVVDLGPVETTGQFPLYLPELMEHVDQTVRTVADREHRGVSGYSVGGFLAHWTAVKFPDLVASASDVNGVMEAPLGPRGFDVDCDLDDLRPAGSGVANLNHAANAAAALDFHMQAFAKPPAKPALFSHVDPYPNFSIWNWEVASNRRQPGFVSLENVSARGFHSVVREWLPGGAALTGTKVDIETPAKLYTPNSTHPVTIVHVPDGKVRRAVQKADAQGRMSFELDGDDYEVGISAEPAVAVSGAEVADAAWATAGKPVQLRVKFWNVGGARSGTLPIQWESPDPHVKFETPSGRLFGMGSGESVSLPVTFTYDGEAPGSAHIVAVEGTNRLPFDVPMFPAAEPAKNFLIADGRPLEAFQHGTQKSEVTLGEGNGDGNAAPSESFAILLPDADSFRVAELFTNDACVDNTVRDADDWGSGVSVNYSVARIRPECQPGHRVHFLARVYSQTPNGPVPHYATIELPVWYRTQGQQK
ncbi:MAG TPA: alpha/beta hydrolase-fold protein [Bryobacteraceae bacterium]|nr:alpha/beta hydrolase-fold protein [Bryobacteraceae bacterium]